MANLQATEDRRQSLRPENESICGARPRVDGVQRNSVVRRGKNRAMISSSIDYYAMALLRNQRWWIIRSRLSAKRSLGKRGFGETAWRDLPVPRLSDARDRRSCHRRFPHRIDRRVIATAKYLVRGDYADRRQRDRRGSSAVH